MTSKYLSNQIVCVQDIEDYAYKVLPKFALDYFRSGAGSEENVKNNRKGFLSYHIKPRVLQNVAVRNLSTRVLGRKITMPIGISPTAMQKLAHLDGECATACAAQAMGTIFILSTMSTCTIEEVSAAAPLACKWFQLYIYKNRDITKALVERAEAAGFEAIVLTVDVPVVSQRRSNIRNTLSLPPHITFANFSNYAGQSSDSNLQTYVSTQFDSSIEWNDIKWLQTITTLPIIVKGILTAEDAVKAINMNVAGIYVSDHGGRQLDTAIAPINALPEIVRAVGNRAEVYLDGGIREGIDVFKAIALGAKMVFVGRPAIWGLVYAGKDGVQDMLNMLKSEFDETLALTGCPSIQSITPHMVVHESYFSRL